MMYMHSTIFSIFASPRKSTSATVLSFQLMPGFISGARVAGRGCTSCAVLCVPLVSGLVKFQRRLNFLKLFTINLVEFGRAAPDQREAR